LLSKRPIASNIGQDHHLDEMTGVVG